MKDIEFLINELKEELIQELEKKCKPHFLNIYSPEYFLKKTDIRKIVNKISIKFLEERIKNEN